jgi:hypothetical protein
MNDNRDEKLDRLFRNARSVRVDTSAREDYFENRVVASIRERREGSQSWFSWAWRLVPVFVVAFIVLGSTSLIVERDSSADIFSAIANGNDEYQVVAYLEGD